MGQQVWLCHFFELAALPLVLLCPPSIVLSYTPSLETLVKLYDIFYTLTGRDGIFF